MSKDIKPTDVREIDCDEVMRQLFDFLDGEVDETVAHEVHHHIEDCRSCFSRVEFERMLKERVRSSSVKAVPESLQERVTELMKSFSLGNMKESGNDK